MEIMRYESEFSVTKLRHHELSQIYNARVQDHKNTIKLVNNSLFNKVCSKIYIQNIYSDISIQAVLQKKCPILQLYYLSTYISKLKK